MADARPPQDRLRRWWAAEVARAEGDIDRGLMRAAGGPGTATHRWPAAGRIGGLAGGLVVALLVVVALVGGPLGGPAGGSGSPSPTGGAGPTTSAGTGPSATPSGGTYADGIPTSLDGAPVLRPAAAATRAASSADASSFLVGGWADLLMPLCPILPSQPPAESVLLGAGCGPAEYVTEAPPSPGQQLPLELHALTSNLTLPTAGPVILRVHTHDPLAAACMPSDRDACERAVVVDAVLWDGPIMGSDGLPTWVDGQQTLTVPQAQAALAGSSSSAHLYVRGWYAGWALPCPYIPPTVPPTPGSSLIPDHCTPAILGAEPIPVGQDQATTSDLDLTLGPDVTAPAQGAVVLEIHGHDPAAAACDPSIRAACDAAVIVDRVVWTGTAPASSTPAPGPTNPTSAAPSPISPPSPVSPSTPIALPTSIDGEAVLRGAAFVDRVAAATDDTSFLVGGWAPTTPEVYACPAQLVPSPGTTPDPVTRLLPCGALWFLDAPGDPTGAPAGSPPWVAVPINVVSLWPVWGSPFVMRVHVHDPLAASCPADQRAACERSVVEESLVWVGP